MFNDYDYRHGQNQTAKLQMNKEVKQSKDEVKDLILSILYVYIWNAMIVSLHYRIKSMWAPAHQISHSRIVGINMELVPLMLL
jgi:hypothetical protein